MPTANKSELPNYIKARNPKRLRALMLKNSVRLQMTVNYFDIQFVNNEWYAWYYEPIHKSDLMESNEPTNS